MFDSDNKTEYVDLERVRNKYAAEKNKRVRADHNQQFVGVEGEFAHFADDPFVSQPLERAAYKDFTEVIIIGAGFGGLLAGAQLRKAGYQDIRIIDKGSDVGGTWYWNRYPGVQCDVESYIYFPLLEETGGMPSKKYAPGKEIHQHSQRLADHFTLYQNTCFQTLVTDVRWSSDDKEWTVTTDQGDVMRARYVCMANGPINLPKLPGIPGIGKFKGRMFHTSRWDYAYTGGDSDGNLDNLADKKVAIIGTGATAIQVVPHLAKYAKQVYVVQRTPTAVDHRNNQATDENWVKSLQPGWQQERADNFNNLIMGRPQEQDMVADGWTDISTKMGRLAEQGALADGRSIDELIETADYQSMQNIRSRCDEVINDASVAEALKPYYRKFCKRPGFHDEYLQSFNQSNVTLVDTLGQGVSEITENGFVFDDTLFEVDLIIFATGFEVGSSYTRRSGYEVTGQNGLKLSEKWQQQPNTLFGIQTHGFPNLFFLGTVHGATGINLTQTLNEQAQHVAHILGEAKKQSAKTVEASLQAEQDWGARVQTSQTQARTDYFVACTPGYYNGEGAQAAKGGFWEHEYGGGSAEFYDILRDFRRYSCLPGILLDGKALAYSTKDSALAKSKKSITSKLQSEYQRVLANMDAFGPMVISELPIATVRQMSEMAATMRAPGPQLASVSDVTINTETNVIARVYDNAKNTNQVIVYFHGGGFCIGSVNEFDAPMRRLCLATGATVVSVDYRLAPEHPFPAAIDDAQEAVGWAANYFSSDAQLFVAGDSAGANLAAAVALLLRDTDIKLAAQILIYPSVTGDADAVHLDAFESPFLTKQDIAYFYKQYIPNPKDRGDFRFAPLHAASHQKLPPAFIARAEFDLLKPEAELYADKLKQAGVLARSEEYKGAMHGFLSVGDGSKTAQQLIDDIAVFITEQV